jgi:hypothetical protein
VLASWRALRGELPTRLPSPWSKIVFRSFDGFHSVRSTLFIPFVRRVPKSKFVAGDPECPRRAGRCGGSRPRDSRAPGRKLYSVRSTLFIPFVRRISFRSFDGCQNLKIVAGDPEHPQHAGAHPRDSPRPARPNRRRKNFRRTNGIFQRSPVHQKHPEKWCFYRLLRPHLPPSRKNFTA